MITLEIEGTPIPWASHQGYGRRSFNPRFKEKEMIRWVAKAQYIGEPIKGPIKIYYKFYMPIPKSLSKSEKEVLYFHTKRPDITNLIKFVEDCIKGIYFEDDSQVCEVVAEKVYSLRPRTVITVAQSVC
jgi:Holliday junction resolvase RusA-like endonuclease